MPKIIYMSPVSQKGIVSVAFSCVSYLLLCPLLAKVSTHADDTLQKNVFS